MGNETVHDPVPGMIRGLKDPAAFPHTVQEVRVIETHISWVILTGEFVYKIKKPASLGFLDFSTPGAAQILLRGRSAPEPPHGAGAVPGRGADR